jgi:hypothetical protein
MHAVYHACIRRAEPSGMTSFAVVDDSGLSSLSFQDIGPMAFNAPGNGCMQCIMHVSVELSHLERPLSPSSTILG